MKKLFLMVSLLISSGLFAPITQENLVKCFKNNNIGKGQYKDQLQLFDLMDTNSIKLWVTNNIQPEWKVNGFKECVDANPTIG